jgi:hypothetical protein
MLLSTIPITLPALREYYYDHYDVDCCDHNDDYCMDYYDHFRFDNLRTSSSGIHRAVIRSFTTRMKRGWEVGSKGAWREILGAEVR